MPGSLQRNTLTSFVLVLLPLLLPYSRAAPPQFTAEASDIIVYPIDELGQQKTVYEFNITYSYQDSSVPLQTSIWHYPQWVEDVIDTSAGEHKAISCVRTVPEHEYTTAETGSSGMDPRAIHPNCTAVAAPHPAVSPHT